MLAEDGYRICGKGIDGIIIATADQPACDAAANAENIIKVAFVIGHNARLYIFDGISSHQIPGIVEASNASANLIFLSQSSYR